MPAFDARIPMMIENDGEPALCAGSVAVNEERDRGD